MQRVFVDSRSIASIGYDPEQHVLELEFKQSGKVYTYLNLHFKFRQYRYHRIQPQEKWIQQLIR